MKPCRDCGAATAMSAQSCPSCGIWNPVQHWVSFPDGSHHTGRAAITAAPAFGLSGAAAATVILAPHATTHRSTHWLGRYFAAIDTRDEAEEAIRDCAKGFYFLAGLQALAGFVLGMGFPFDAVLFAGLAYWLQSRSSQVAAVLLLALASLGFIVTIMAQLGMVIGGRNVILAVFTLLIAWRGVKATRALVQLRPA